MELIKVRDYNEMSQKAAELLIGKVKSSSQINLGLATGGTPKGLYDKMIEEHQKNGTSYKHVTTFNLDEYAGLSEDNPNSYHYYMNESLFKHIDILNSNTHLPKGISEHLEKECTEYDKMIAENGGIDLQVLGIGQNGHIGFNEPGTSFESNTHVVKLADSTREANARYFETIDDVPTHAITMGIASIMKSKEILLLVSGEEKQEAMDKLLRGKVTEEFPASILQKHPRVTIIADQKALSRVLITP